MKFKMKQLNEYNKGTADQYREDGFKFFNTNILKFMKDENTPLLEKINFISIVLSNYYEHLGRAYDKDCTWIKGDLLINFIDVCIKMNQWFLEVDLSPLKNFKLDLPTMYPNRESSKDQPILITSTMSLKYIRKNDIKNVVFDGINNVPITFIKDFGLELNISKPEKMTIQYFERSIRNMNKSYIPEMIIWINQNTPKEKIKVLWEYAQSISHMPIFLNVDILNCINYGATEDENNLKYAPYKQKYRERNYFNQINFCEVIRVPDESFDEVIDFYDQAIHNPEVSEIYITFYRTSISGKLIDTLIKGTHLGKKINVYIEMTARGDEENNLNLLKRFFKESDLNYLHIFRKKNKYKVHAKIGLVILKNGKVIAHCGTGNFNEVTAKIYKDTHIITDDKKIINDIMDTFRAIDHPKGKGKVKLKRILRNEIQKEIQKGQNGKIVLVCNHIGDSEILELLKVAKVRHCEVVLLPRSTFGYPEKLFGKKVFRGGRFLEHERIYFFGKGNNPRVYLSSSDILFRNLYKRIEYTFKLPDYVDKSEFMKGIEKWLH